MRQPKQRSNIRLVRLHAWLDLAGKLHRAAARSQSQSSRNASLKKA
jgi:hypothetical protein